MPINQLQTEICSRRRTMSTSQPAPAANSAEPETVYRSV